MQAFFRGRYVDFADAKVSVMTHALNYGTGCFEGIRGYWNPDDEQMYLFRVPEHFQRLHRSAKILRMRIPHSVEELCEIAAEVVRRNELREDVYVRPLVYKSAEQIGLSMVRKTSNGAQPVEDGFTLFAVPFGNYLDVEKPIRCCVSSWFRITDNMIPPRAKVTGIYVNSALAKTDAIENGFDEAIMLTSEGHVSEGSGENVFLVRDGALVTPSTSDDILEGITRSTIIQIARDELGIPTVERGVDRTELYIADELFLVGTGAQISPVAEVDRRTVGSGGIGPITAHLQKLYFDLVRGRNPKYAHWCMGILPAKVGLRSR